MKAVLAVSFGTTVDETREKTIGAVERELAEAFPEHQLFRAFTSQKIVKALKKTGKGSFCTVWEALDEIAERGADELTVQPTFLTAGGEYGCLSGFWPIRLSAKRHIWENLCWIQQRTEYRQSALCGKSCLHYIMGKFVFWQGMERSVHPMMRERAVGVGEKILLPGQRKKWKISLTQWKLWPVR